MRNGMVRDFVALIVELLGQPIVVPLVCDIESSPDRTAIRIFTLGAKDLFVESAEISKRNRKSRFYLSNLHNFITSIKPYRLLTD